MGRIRIQLLDPDPDPLDFRIKEFNPDPHRGSTQGGLGSIRLDPDLHKFAKTCLFWLDKLMIHLNKILLYTPVLVSAFTTLKMQQVFN